ncbi:hypothetical protein [Halobacillus sp. H74]|uniref:hypothetical protein n=1 Tax=Halobacillus sp. H74 TaxID=3457436 RepID=UPI003FCEC811
MNLIDLYIHEVTRRLPEKNRDDIEMELRSTILDMLPEENYTEEEIKKVLVTLGDPALLASRYNDRPSYLIGPGLYDKYLSILKMAMPIILFIILLVTAIEEIFIYSGDTGLFSIFAGLLAELSGSAINAAIHVFFWITIVFILIERFAPRKEEHQNIFNRKWTPEQLKERPIIHEKREIKRWEVLLGLLWTAIWASLYFNTPRLIAIYENSNNGLQFATSIINEDILLAYWGIVSLSVVLEIGIAVYKWRVRQWTKRLAWINACTNAVFFIFAWIIITDPRLFNNSAIRIIGDNLNMESTEVLIWLGVSVLIGIAIACMIDSYEGFKKAYKGIKKNQQSEGKLND